MPNNWDNIREEELKQLVIAAGAGNGAVLSAADVVTDRSFRDICASNGCGMFGKCYMCPPDVGDIEELMAKIRTFEQAFLYQTVIPLEDSYDFEGMMEGRMKHQRITMEVEKVLKTWMNAENHAADAEKTTTGNEEKVQAGNVKKAPEYLHLGVGGCGVCRPCAKIAGEPCRFPDLAMASMESYGINVAETAAKAGLKYINGANTVTYFSIILMH